MQTKLQQVIIHHKTKPYVYLFIVIPHKIMDSLKPAQLTIQTTPPITLQINRRANGRGYAILPTELINDLNLTSGQKVEIFFSNSNGGINIAKQKKVEPAKPAVAPAPAPASVKPAEQPIKKKK